MRTICTILAFGLLASCSVSKDPLRPTARKLQQGRLIEDSSYVYALPFPVGTQYLVVQGYFSKFSHRNRAAIDFKMKQGTPIAAARDGVVIRTRSDQTRGGWNKKYRQNANYIVIEHEDGTRAGYWHLQKGGVLVQPGDTVRQGQVIGRSGHTGYSAFPHLHFFVWSGKVHEDWKQLPTRFYTTKGPVYLRPMRSYKSIAVDIISKSPAPPNRNGQQKLLH